MQRKITNQLAATKLYSDLTSNSGTLILARLVELDEKVPSTTEAAILKKAFDEEKDEVLSFQMKKSLRFMAGKFKNVKYKVEVEAFKGLLAKPERIEDTALALLALSPGTAFILADIIRASAWQSMRAEILPSFCQFFKAYGGVEDVQTLLELTRHPNAIVLTSAINALETIDPTNLQGIVEPLLTSSTIDTKAQAIQVLYKWNKTEAIKHFRALLLSSNRAEKALALHHAQRLNYSEMEALLLEMLGTELDTSLLLSLSKIFIQNAHLQLPIMLHQKITKLSGEQQKLSKGILLNVIRQLSKIGLIEVSVQDYLKKLKENSIIAQPKEITKPIAPIEASVESVLEAGNEEKVSLDLESTLANYSFLSEKEKIQFIHKITPEFFINNRPSLFSIMTLAEDKELGAFIRLIGRFGNEEDALKIKSLCKSNNPDIVCSCIKALSTLDIEFLCLYIPQFLQDKNGKVRMTATRVVAQIDPSRIVSLLTGMISSPNTRLRNLGVSTSMLVDFNLVRQPLINALAKEKSLELLEKISTVLASNPDKEMLSEVYKISKNRTYEQKEMEVVLNNIAEKLSITINKEQSPEEILAEVVTGYKKEKAELKKKRIEDLKNETEENKLAAQKKVEQEEKTSVRSKISLAILILAGVAWGGLMAYLLLLLLGG